MAGPLNLKSLADFFNKIGQKLSLGYGKMDRAKHPLRSGTFCWRFYSRKPLYEASAAGTGANPLGSKCAASS